MKTERLMIMTAIRLGVVNGVRSKKVSLTH